MGQTRKGLVHLLCRMEELNTYTEISVFFSPFPYKNFVLLFPLKISNSDSVVEPASESVELSTTVRLLDNSKTIFSR